MLKSVVLMRCVRSILMPGATLPLLNESCGRDGCASSLTSTRASVGRGKFAHLRCEFVRESERSGDLLPVRVAAECLNKDDEPSLEAVRLYIFSTPRIIHDAFCNFVQIVRAGHLIRITLLTCLGLLRVSDRHCGDSDPYTHYRKF